MGSRRFPSGTYRANVNVITQNSNINNKLKFTDQVGNPLPVDVLGRERADEVLVDIRRDDKPAALGEAGLAQRLEEREAPGRHSGVEHNLSAAGFADPQLAVISPPFRPPQWRWPGRRRVLPSDL